MFLPPEIRPVPRGEPSPEPYRITRREKLATVLIAVAMVVALLAPEVGAAVFVIVRGR